MKVIIAGSRHIHSYVILKQAVQCSMFIITEVVSGNAPGVDRLGERWALDNNVTVRPFPAKWGEYGNAAGPIRNIAMAHYADALVAVWDGRSKGTKHMIETMQQLGKVVHVHTIEI